MVDDNELIKRIYNGETKLFELLVDKYGQRIYTLCYGVLHNSLDAEDATQEVFLNIYMSLKNFKGSSTLYTWIYRIALNSSLEYLKRKSNAQCKKTESITDNRLIVSIASLNELPDKLLVDKDNEKLIADALNAIPEKQRKVFLLKKYEYLSQKEIADIMCLSEGVVEQLFQKAKHSLKMYITRKININEL